MAGTGDGSGTEAGKQAFVITRAFDVPREFMFKVWTDTKHLQHWWGPKGVKLVSCKLDLRPGGIFHYCLQTPDG